ncbi:hypothetical protein AB1Y20_011012 [Prymnesium parvum]|uniref:Protein-tyrosine-phosphatase n=1 Tax=Prymnesium parvum TaxID=97485 RepID=A0AB34IKL4_PRYPA
MPSPLSSPSAAPRSRSALDTREEAMEDSRDEDRREEDTKEDRRDEDRREDDTREDDTREAEDHAAPGVLVGPYLYAKSRSWLVRHHVTHIVNATPSAPCRFEAEGIRYLRVPIEDRVASPIGEHFARVCAFIREAVEAGGVVLVHCHMGRSRSVALACAYLIAQGSTAQQAIERLQAVRRGAAPNSGFVRALREWEAAARGGRRAYAAFDRLLEEKPQLDEIAYVPGPLTEELFAPAEAAQGVEAARADDSLLALCAGGKAAIDVSALPRLLAETKAEWLSTRRQWRDGLPAAPLRRATRALLLLTAGQSYSAWNDRKRTLLAAPPHALLEELSFSRLVLSSFPKAHEAYAHRRHLLSRLDERAGRQLPAELELCEAAQRRRAANFHAARHLSFAVARAPPPLLERAAAATRAAAAACPSDASVLHCRRAFLRAAARASLLDEELEWCVGQMRRTPWHECLWQHRRILLCWKAAAAGGEAGGEGCVRPVEEAAAALDELCRTSGLLPDQLARVERCAWVHAAWCSQPRCMPLTVVQMAPE